ncbi:hypothetical protein F4821DRAFT_273721 [Hypoxylon rubiginosum]|uniref:Uncharacterized protein n=1 Tax=Hypoxylon rubiginosum TaxID=110542 RepID=A0ACC0CJK2_9PEZI|nr:hypothetical protein F4821DRAFT_273721 [Hypoxylon rubiginosum]
MLFWDTIFPDAMIWLKEKFEEPKDRCATGYSIRDMKDWTEVYEVVENCRDKYLNGGQSMIMKRGLRWFADNITPFQESLKLIPDVDYVSPVRGTLGFIMDAVKRASETRQKLLQGLDNLDSIFKDIELFLNTFPTEKNVCEAGRDLVVSVLVAAEKLIGFYLKQKGKKVVAALFKGDDYEKSVVNSLQDITSKSENLRHEATKADMSQSARNWKLAEHRHNELRESQIVLQDGQERIIHNQDTQAGNLTRTIQAGVRIMSNGMNDIYNLMVEHERNKDQLLQRNADLQKQVSDLKYTTDVLQRALTPKLIATSGGGWHITPNDLWDMFGDRCFDDRDTQYTLDMQEQVPIHDRAIAESLVTLPRFREWMVVATSRELLVHGNSPSNHPISPLSVFCSTFSQALRHNPRFISLVYFCSLHADYDDPNAGPQCMMMSFIAQLILQGEFDTTFLHHDVDVSWVQRDEEPYMEDLCEMMKWLIYQLPAEMTVFCVIDGVNAYEKGPYVHDFVDGLACILDLVIDPKVQATVKVLVTSPSRTLEVREGFHDDDMVVLTTGQLHTNMEASPRHSQHRISRVLENSEREYF